MSLLILIFIGNMMKICNGLERFSISFEDEVRKGKASAMCLFRINYDDKDVHDDSNVSCPNAKKTMNVDYEHNSKTMHKINLKLKITKRNAKIIKSSVERGKA